MRSLFSKPPWLSFFTTLYTHTHPETKFRIMSTENFFFMCSETIFSWIHSTSKYVINCVCVCVSLILNMKILFFPHELTQSFIINNIKKKVVKQIFCFVYLGNHFKSFMVGLADEMRITDFRSAAPIKASLKFLCWWSRFGVHFIRAFYGKKYKR